MIIVLPGSGHQGFSQVYLNLPDSVFVKTEATLGIDVGALFVDHMNFGAYAPRDNVFYYGEIETLSIRDFLEVELETGELYEVLTGLVQIALDSASTLSFENNKILLTTPLQEGEMQYWIDPEKYVVVESRLVHPDGKEVLVKEFQRFRERNGVFLPQIIRLTRPEVKERITVYYTRHKINKSISPAKFRMKISDSARRVYWGDVEKPKVDRDFKGNSKSQ